MILASDSTLTTYGGRDGSWNEALLAACPSLRAGCVPPRWARNAHVQNLLTIVRDRTTPPVTWDLDERLVLADGGTVSIQWLGLDANADTPVLVAMHTIRGSGDGLRRFLVSVREKLGWVVAACNRRGHAGLPLTAPQINTMGSTADLRAQLAAIEVRRPGAPLYAIGMSAGSGLLVRYLGEEAERSRLRAAIAICPAYDIPGAFRYVHPGYDAYMTRQLVDFFLRRNEQVLGRVDGFAECAASTSIVEFHERLYPLAGYESAEAYFRGSNPMAVALASTTPVLVVNSADDPVCAEANVHRHLDAMTTLPRMTLALTRRGSHCGFFEGPLARESWIDRVSAEYLSAAHRLLCGERPAGDAGTGPRRCRSS